MTSAVSRTLPLPLRKGDWLQTYKGVQFWPMDARPEEVDIGDIAHALAHQCRFGGHTNSFYSVAQHSVIVSNNVPNHLAVQGLLHDATEAYIVDVPTPIKKYLTNYKEIEHGLAKVIGRRFGVELADLSKEVKSADARALWTEKRDLRGPTPAAWGVPRRNPFFELIQPLPPGAAEVLFLERCRELGVK